MTHELWILLMATLWGLVHLTVASFTFKGQVGMKYSVGARDEALVPEGMAGRMQRAQNNFQETYPFFAVCIVIVYLTSSAGALSFWGGILYLAGRVLFLPLYAIGIPWLRTFSWNIATLGLVLVGVQPVLS